MSPILPYEIRVKVMQYFDEGCLPDEVCEKIRKEAEPYLKSNLRPNLRPNVVLRRCVTSIYGHWKQGQRPKKVKADR